MDTKADESSDHSTVPSQLKNKKRNEKVMIILLPLLLFVISDHQDFYIQFQTQLSLIIY